MCTVTYIPTKRGFHLTSNRDENVNRSQAVAPFEYESDKNKLLYPKDADKNGSWIAAKNNGDMVVLLNGAFVKHELKQLYRKSRGLVLMDIINAKQPAHYYNEMNLDDIEPFTLVLYADGTLYECRWDGEKKHIARLNPNMAYIWSSVTLYDKMARAKRNSWFNDWRNSNHPRTTEGILNFHRYGGDGDSRDGLVINRNERMKTVSITNIRVNEDKITMTYDDLKHGQEYVNELNIVKKKVQTVTKSNPRFLKLRSFFIRLFNWEYWSFNTVYTPIMFYWFWLSLKARSFFFFSTVNPLIENGGFAMESKDLIYDLIPQKYYPKTLYFKVGTGIEEINAAFTHQPFSYPLIAKPDIGGRGVQVKLVYNEEDLIAYIKQIKVDFLVQEYIPYKNEVGLFYYRLPGENKGHISGIVGKEFLTVKGDGSSTIKDLLIAEPRYLLQLSVLLQTEGELLTQVLPANESLTLVPYGNHARGAKFIDLSHLITDELTGSMDAVCKQIPGFYFGRLDIMYNNWEELSRGENFSIIELNGAGSEPTHIYDPSHSIFFAWKEIIRHWKLLYQIGKLNNQANGTTYMSYKQGVDLLKRNSAYLKIVA
jgi:hypothetical protein